MAELRDLRVSARCSIPAELLSVRFSRAGGPGGQHVNRTETKVDLRLDLERCVAVIGEERVAKIRDRLKNRLDGDGNLQIVSSEHRQQSLNLDAAIVRMEGLIRTALAPQKVRKKTRPSRSSQQRRLDQKKQRGETKRRRRPVDD